jgi:acid phosphatase (class A)
MFERIARYIVPAVMVLVIVPAVFTQGVRKAIFVSAEQLDTTSILISPPAKTSDETKADLAELHRLQETRSPAQVLRAQNDESEEDIFIFKDVLGERFNREALPMTALLSGHVQNDVGIIVNPAKAFFQRPRPYRQDETLKPVCKVRESATDYSYPSGTATTGYLEGLVLTLMLPEKRDAILTRAEDYAHNRLICGVHHPSDIQASKQVAYAAIGIIMNNPQFKKELAAAKAETRAALGLQSSN